jgi:hypothetical protein
MTNPKATFGLKRSASSLRNLGGNWQASIALMSWPLFDRCVMALKFWSTSGAGLPKLARSLVPGFK